MSYSDPIGELLTRIRNALRAQHRYVDIHLSNIRLGIIKILKEKGYIENFLVNEAKRKMRIFLKYTRNRKPLIQGLKRISSPGLRRYLGYDEIPMIYGGIGTSILSTSKGIIDGNAAKKMQIGGELLCFVW